MPSFVDERANASEYLPQQPTGTSAPRTVVRGATRATSGDVGPVVDYIAARGFTFEPWQVAAFVTAVRTKPFVILAGISGTGKTRLPRLVAEATGAQPAIVVPVRPDWTDSSDLLGYTALSGQFHPGRLLTACKEAIANPAEQYFFVLDEMNVARVEYYFAEVLSIMENRRLDESGTVVSDALNPTAPDDWADVYLPPNLAIVGTVNMDETTHGFSRKVLDRAFVIELTEVDLEDFGSISDDQPQSLDWTAEHWAVESLRLAESANLSDPVVSEVVDALVNANEALRLAQLQVGYRVRDESVLFCLAARGNVELFVDRDSSPVTPLDLCIGMKVLPRIQGGGTLIGRVLAELNRWMTPEAPAVSSAVDDNSDSAENLQSGAVTFPRSHERVTLMVERLTQTGFTSYWV